MKTTKALKKALAVTILIVAAAAIFSYNPTVAKADTTTTAASTTDKTYTIKMNGTSKAVVGHYDTAMEKKLVKALNKYRKSNGVKKLKSNSKLAKAADIRAYEITESFSHTRPDGSTCFSVSKLVSGENIAYGYDSVNSLMNAWKNSASHNENMLYGEFKKIGISVFAAKEVVNGTVSYTYYAVQNFGY